MEDNSNMSGPPTSGTDEVGGNGENISDLVVVLVFGNDCQQRYNARTLPPKDYK